MELGLGIGDWEWGTGYHTVSSTFPSISLTLDLIPPATEVISLELHCRTIMLSYCSNIVQRHQLLRAHNIIGLLLIMNIIENF